MDANVGGFGDGEDVLKDVVCATVPTPTFGPALDDTLVFSIYFNAPMTKADEEESPDEELEADCFQPSNVAIISFPRWQRPPCPPSSFDEDPDTVLEMETRIYIHFSLVLRELKKYKACLRCVNCLYTVSVEQARDAPSTRGNFQIHCDGSFRIDTQAKDVQSSRS